MHITTLRRRIEVLEEAESRTCARAAVERFRDRALDSLSDDQLVALVEWLRAMSGEGGKPGESAWDGWEAYQTALAREQAAGAGHPSTGVKR